MSERQSKVLGLILKFRPSLRPPSLATFQEHIAEFSRSVRLHYRFANEPEDPSFNPRLYVKSNWNPPREDFERLKKLSIVFRRICAIILVCARLSGKTAFLYRTEQNFKTLKRMRPISVFVDELVKPAISYA